MQHEIIEFRGSYRYADLMSLQRVLHRARVELDDDDESNPAWIRGFVARGTTLNVSLSVAAAAQERFIAANVLLILAHGAIEGAVEARHRDQQIDLFPSGCDD